MIAIAIAVPIIAFTLFLVFDILRMDMAHRAHHKNRMRSLEQTMLSELEVCHEALKGRSKKKLNKRYKKERFIYS